MVVPVVLIHSGLQPYLYTCINQALKNNEVYLLGSSDPSVDHYNFTYVNPSEQNLGKDIREFSDIYVHLNTTPPDYELFCYTRWFMLRNFMEANDLPVVMYIDSDVLLFQNATEGWQNFSNYIMSLVHRTSGHTSFMTQEGINSFCDMLMSIYSDKAGYHFNKIKSHLDIRQAAGLPGGVCDMTLLEYFHYHAEFGGGPGRVGEMMSIINDSTYDHNFNVSDEDYEFGKHSPLIKMDTAGTKIVTRYEGNPAVYNHRLGKNIKFNSLHFQGGAKGLMGNIYEKFLEE